MPNFAHFTTTKSSGSGNDVSDKFQILIVALSLSLSIKLLPLGILQDVWQQQKMEKNRLRSKSPLSDVSQHRKPPPVIFGIEIDTRLVLVLSPRSLSYYASELWVFVYLMNITTQISFCHSNEYKFKGVPNLRCPGSSWLTNWLAVCLHSPVWLLNGLTHSDVCKQTTSTTAFKLNCKRFYHRI